MTVIEIERPEIRSPFVDDTNPLPQPRTADPFNRDSFRNAFSYAIEQVDQAQTEAGKEIEAFIAGEQENLHEVSIKMNQAKLSFQLMLEVRNKMMETYQELFRMQM